MAQILFMRHPETEGNVAHWYSGRRNVELSDRGAEQCARAIRALVAWQPDVIVSSPLVRCRSIAFGAAICLGLEPIIDDRLIEIDFGAIESMTSSEARAQGLVFPWPVDEDGVSHPVPGGESFEHIEARAQAFLDDVRWLDGRIACVAHGGMMRAIMAAAYGMDLSRFWDMSIDNVTSQIFIEKDGKLQLSAMGLTPEEVAARGLAWQAERRET